VATHLRQSGIFSDCFIADFFEIDTERILKIIHYLMKDVWMCRILGLLFLTHPVVQLCDKSVVVSEPVVTAECRHFFTNVF